MKYRFHPEARAEVDYHAQKYKKDQPGREQLFLSEIALGIDDIIDHPKAWPLVEPGIRKWITNRFPFKVLYHFYEERQEIYIIAVAHYRQKPGYWKDRFPS